MSRARLRRGTFVCRVVILLAVAPLSAWCDSPAPPSPPKDLKIQDVRAPQVLGPRWEGIVVLPDGALKRFVPESGGEGTYRNYAVISRDGGATWGEKKLEYEGPAAFLPLLDRDGEYHVFPMAARTEGAGRTIAVDLFIDIWHVRTRDKGAVWEKPQVIFKGYVGSINCVVQLRSGRIVVPFAEWIGDRPEGPPTGANAVTCAYSDDGGVTWQQSSAGTQGPAARLTAPCYTDFNGSGYGACEPVIVELNDGRVYMLARTETGRLYESYSNDGVQWEELRPSQFLSSDAPAGFLRLPDGRILLFLNACEKPPREEGAGVYGGRDALHAAISVNEGRTWRGFREVYLDPTRNESPQRAGDRGTAYPMPYLGSYGKVVVPVGQGRSAATLVFDPDWLLETHREDDFSKGLDGWSVFTHFGPAKGWWQDRTQGAVLIDHPSKVGSKALHIRRPEGKPADGAVWNFPMGRKGALNLRLLLNDGFGGAAVALLDRFFNPNDPNVAGEGLYSLPIEPDGHISLASTLSKGTWHALRFEWDLTRGVCVVSVDGTASVYLKPSYRQALGINYVHIRSRATTTDPGGLLIESVTADIEPM